MNHIHLWGRRAIVIIGLFALLFALIAMPYYLPTTWLDVIGIGPSTETTKTISGSQVSTTVRDIGAKTVWDWAELLVVPLVLALGGYWFTRTENRHSLMLQQCREDEARKLEAERSQDAAVQAYLDQMTQLLLHEGLRTSAHNAEVRSVARSRTLTVLRILGAKRKVTILQFLYESGLIIATKHPAGGFGKNIIVPTSEDKLAQLTREATVEALQKIGAAGQTIRLRSNLPREKIGAIIDLSGADLVGVVLAGFDLNGASLFGINLSGANLAGADLAGASLVKANLTGVDFTGADLSEADLMGANLKGANFRDADLYEVDFSGAMLEEAIVDKDALCDALLYPTQKKVGQTWRGYVLTENGFWERTSE